MSTVKTMAELKRRLKMKTQKEYMEKIKNEFVASFKLRKQILDAYGYNDKRACDLIGSFKENVKKYGLKFSNCYNPNGIGNGNDYTIYIEAKDNDGFIIHKYIANFYYCYGIYGELKDLATEEKITIGKAR